jgi:TPR repeat protein
MIRHLLDTVAWAVVYIEGKFNGKIFQIFSPLVELFHPYNLSGDLQAQLGLGQLYLQGGRGIEKNIRLAQNYFSAAAKSGSDC